MGDPLSIAASIAALLDVTKKLIDFGIDFYKAKEAHQGYVAKLSNLSTLIEVVSNRLREALNGPNETWNQTVLKGLAPDKNPNGSLVRLQVLTDELQAKQDDWKGRGLDQRFLHHWKKDSIATTFDEISKCWIEINVVLDAGHYELSKEHYDLSRNQYGMQQNQLHLSESQLALQQSQYGLQETQLDLSQELISMSRNQLELQRSGSDEIITKFQALASTLAKEREEDQRRRQVKEEKRLRAAIEQWLSPLEPLARQRDLINKCYPTGQWLLDSIEFKSWSEGRPWQLRCLGSTGSGKTSLSAIVVDHLKRKYQTETRPVICIYLSEKEAENHTPENLIGTMLKQMVQLRSSRPVSSRLQNLYEQSQSIGVKIKSLKLRELKELFSAELETYERLYLVVDALNECSPKSRRYVEEELPKLYERNLSLMITATKDEAEYAEVICNLCGKENVRYYLHCGICNDGDFDLCGTCKHEGETCYDSSHELMEPSRVEIEVRATNEEIEGYVDSVLNEEDPQEALEAWRDKRLHPKRHHMSKLSRKLAKEPDLRKRIPTTVVEKSQGKFLLAKLYMDSLITKTTLRDLTYTLDNFPNKWEEFYEERLQQHIFAQKEQSDVDLAKRVLSIAMSARRPLTLSELQHALAIEPGDVEFNTKIDYDREEILEFTQGLLMIDDGDDEHSYVRFFHLTFQKYLTENQDRLLPGAESKLASACLTCLNYNIFSNRIHNEDEIDDKIKDNPFTQYALQYWGDHVRKANDSEVDSLALQYLQDPGRLAAFIQAAWHTGEQKFDSWDVRRDIDPMHICAFFGLSSLILKLGLDNYDVNVQEKTYGQTPLMYACKRGHTDTARQLLELGADINTVSSKGRTALLEAMHSDYPHHEDVVELLLNRKKLNVNAVDAENQNRTPLMVAIQMNLERTVDLLLERKDLDVNIADEPRGFSALSYAAAKGSPGLVAALLKRSDLDINQVDSVGRSPLVHAAAFAQTHDAEIIQMLLDHGADPNVQDQQGGNTAVTEAIEVIERDNSEAIHVLISSPKTNLFAVNDVGDGLLHTAVAAGRDDVVRLLVDKQLDVNLKNHAGLTPLHKLASSNEAECLETAKLLLELKADPTIEDAHGRTPLALAAEFGNDELAQFLRQSGAVDSTTHGGVLEQPLWRLVKLGDITAIAKAIAEGTANMNEMEPLTGDDPLRIAVRTKRHDIMELLLKEGKCDPNTLGQYNSTSLHLASIQDDIPAVTLLLAHNANANALDQFSYTPLSRAEQESNLPLALVLITAGGCALSPRSNHIQKLFFAAVESGNLAAAKILLEKAKPDPMRKNDQGLVPRQIAKRNGDVEMMRLLDPARSFVFVVPEGEKGKLGGRVGVATLPSPPEGVVLPGRGLHARGGSNGEEAILEEPLEID